MYHYLMQKNIIVGTRILICLINADVPIVSTNFFFNLNSIKWGCKIWLSPQTLSPQTLDGQGDFPWPAPLAWTTLSGILSLSKCAISSLNTKSWTRTGPRGPAVIVAVFSPIGAPVPVVHCSGVWNRYREGGNWNATLHLVVIINAKRFQHLLYKRICN